MADVALKWGAGGGAVPVVLPHSVVRPQSSWLSKLMLKTSHFGRCQFKKKKMKHNKKH